MMKKIKLENANGERLDQWLAQHQPELSRSQWQKRIKTGEVRVNKTKKSVHYALCEGDEITIHLLQKPQLAVDAKGSVPFEVLFENEAYLIINKPAGVVVHPGAGNLTQTLVQGLREQLGHELSDLGGADRPGIVHRLDKNTSGLLVIAKTNKAHQSLAQQFEKRIVKKIYLALVKGHVKPEKGTIEAPLSRNEKQRKKITISSRAGSRHAVTHYTVLHHFSEPFKASLLEVNIETGRTHQIRVHLSAIHHPILGDGEYGNHEINQAAANQGLHRQFLHAAELSFIDPLTHKNVTFKAPLPQELSDFLELRFGLYF